MYKIEKRFLKPELDSSKMFQKQKSDSAVIMPLTDAILIFIFDICLPTWDVFSDLIFAFTLIIPRYYEYSDSVESHPKFGIAMIVPMFFATLFILKEWWNMEKNTSMNNKILTFLLVIFQIYPQWKAGTILHMGILKKQTEWKEEQDKIERNLGFLGKFQLFFLFKKN